MYSNEIVKNDIEMIIGCDINFEKFKGKSVLITGATGMLAAYYMCTLMKLNDKYNYNIKIYALVRNINKLRDIIGNRNDVYPIVQDVIENIKITENINYIIHMASSSNPSTITTDPVGIIKANVQGTINILELAKEKNAKIVFTSTREVYGKVDATSIKEVDSGILDQTEVRSCYPESKRMAENLIICYAYQYGINYQIVRIAHSYGPGMIIKNDGRIMADLINNVVENKDIVLKSLGNAKRAFCYVSDAVSAMFYVTLNDEYDQIYNIANEKEEISIKNLASMLASDNGLNVQYKLEENNNKYVKFERVKLDTNKIEKLGWNPLISLNTGVNRTVEYFSSKINKN